MGNTLAYYGASTIIAVKVLFHRFLVLHANIRLGLPGTNTLAYFTAASATNKNMFNDVGTWNNVIKLFTSVIYEFS
jgi:predicted ribosomally synthesized peptide with SipW-like signal peptide